MGRGGRAVGTIGQGDFQTLAVIDDLPKDEAVDRDVAQRVRREHHAVAARRHAGCGDEVVDLGDRLQGEAADFGEVQQFPAQTVIGVELRVDECLPGQVGGMDLGAVGQRVGGGERQQGRLAIECDRFHRRRVARSWPDQAKVQSRIGDRRNLLWRFDHCRAHLQQRQFPPHQAEQRGQHATDRGGEDVAHLDAPGVPARRQSADPFGPLELGDRLAGVNEEDFPGAGHRNRRALAAVEQRRADHILQPFDLRAEYRLRDIQPVGRAGEVQVVGQRDETAQGLGVDHGRF